MIKSCQTFKSLRGISNGRIEVLLANGRKFSYWPIMPESLPLTEEELDAIAAEIEDSVKNQILWHGGRPNIVCLCGSTRFMDAFFAQGWLETLKGNIVLSVGVAKHVETPDGGHVGEALGPEICAILDELHKRKIDLSDEILVLNVGGYIGESTRSEIDYAIAHGKPVRYLEAVDGA